MLSVLVTNYLWCNWLQTRIGRTFLSFSTWCSWTYIAIFDTRRSSFTTKGVKSTGNQFLLSLSCDNSIYITCWWTALQLLLMVHHWAKLCIWTLDVTSHSTINILLIVWVVWRGRCLHRLSIYSESIWREGVTTLWLFGQSLRFLSRLANHTLLCTDWVLLRSMCA